MYVKTALTLATLSLPDYFSRLLSLRSRLRFLTKPRTECWKSPQIVGESLLALRRLLRHFSLLKPQSQAPSTEQQHCWMNDGPAIKIARSSFFLHNNVRPTRGQFSTCVLTPSIWFLNEICQLLISFQVTGKTVCRILSKIGTYF